MPVCPRYSFIAKFYHQSLQREYRFTYSVMSNFNTFSCQEESKTTIYLHWLKYKNQMALFAPEGILNTSFADTFFFWKWSKGKKNAFLMFSSYTMVGQSAKSEPKLNHGWALLGPYFTAAYHWYRRPNSSVLSMTDHRLEVWKSGQHIRSLVCSAFKWKLFMFGTSQNLVEVYANQFLFLSIFDHKWCLLCVLCNSAYVCAAQ